MRTVVSAILMALLLGGCSSTAASYDSAAQIGTELRDAGIECSDFDASSGAELVRDQGSCSGNDIYVFADEETRDRWLSVGAGLGEVVVGPNWAVVTDDPKPVADALGGDLR